MFSLRDNICSFCLGNWDGISKCCSCEPSSWWSASLRVTYFLEITKNKSPYVSSWVIIKMCCLHWQIGALICKWQDPGCQLGQIILQNNGKKDLRATLQVCISVYEAETFKYDWHQQFLLEYSTLKMWELQKLKSFYLIKTKSKTFL